LESNELPSKTSVAALAAPATHTGRMYPFVVVEK